MYCNVCAELSLPALHFALANFPRRITDLPGVTVAVVVVLLTAVAYILFRKQVRAKEMIKLHALLTQKPCCHANARIVSITYSNAQGYVSC